MKRIQLFGLLALTGVLAVSCAHKQKKAGTSPYDANPYYAGTGGGSSSTASAPGAAQYPTYTDSDPAPAAPSPAPTYPSYTGGSEPNPADNAYPGYSGSNDTGNTYNPYPSNGGYSGGGSTHTVAAGENLYRISLRYGTTVRAIQEANGLGSDRINAGQVLRIP